MTWSCDWLTPAAGVDSTATAWSPVVLEPAVPAPALADEPEPDAEAVREQALQAQLREAYEHGRADGVREANALSGTRVQAAVQALAIACDELQALREPWQREAQAHLTALATGIAHHVIEREVRSDAGIIADLVRRALATFPLGESVRIRIHPEDLSTLSLGRTTGELKLAPGRQAEWVADESVSPGGCLVEGPKRVVDGRVRQVLERVYEALTHA